MIRGSEIVPLQDRAPADSLELSYEQRFCRRKILQTNGGKAFLLDLPKPTELMSGYAIQLEDGALVAILEASEQIMRAWPERSQELARVAWHVGNRHTPCQIFDDHLVLKPDKVLADMLEVLGCRIDYAVGTFQPERGAFGVGRTHSHEH